MELLLPFHLIFIILILTSSSPPSYLRPVIASTIYGNSTDLDALLHFQAQADPHGVLAATWTPNTSVCSWVGVLCSSRRQRVIAIQLYDLALQGTISPHLGNLSFLSYLYLFNNSLIGPIPESIGHLPLLTDINLYGNSLDGSIPPSIFNMSSLITLSVAGNNLSGPLPSNNNSFPMPPRLIGISLSENRFTGDILPSFLQCQDIQIIGLTENLFSGSIPAEIGTLSNLNGLFLGGNQLTGTIPSSLGNLTKLTNLELGRNNLWGIIPEELGKLVNLQRLNLAENGNMVGSIPTSLLNLSMLNFFDLGHNNLTGSVVGGIGNSLPMLYWFHVGEYATMGVVSRMGDVHSFGILLLEIFTRKKPVDSMFGGQSSLREWVCKANTIMDVVDTNILKYHSMDNDLQKLHRCLSYVIELGLVCSKYSPKERIPMTDVVVRLQKIKVEYLSSYIALGS